MYRYGAYKSPELQLFINLKDKKEFKGSPLQTAFLPALISRQLSMSTPTVLLAVVTRTTQLSFEVELKQQDARTMLGHFYVEAGELQSKVPLLSGYAYAKEPKQIGIVQLSFLEDNFDAVLQLLPCYTVLEAGSLIPGLKGNRFSSHSVKAELQRKTSIKINKAKLVLSDE